jgi:hypothetical protein
VPPTMRSRSIRECAPIPASPNQSRAHAVRDGTLEGCPAGTRQSAGGHPPRCIARTRRAGRTARAYTGRAHKLWPRPSVPSSSLPAAETAPPREPRSAARSARNKAAAAALLRRRRG